MSLDLVIAYRIYPKISKHPAAFAHDKYRLSELCLASLKRSLGSLRFKIYALLDGCPPEYEALFRRYFSGAELELIPLPGIGNFATFDRQIELLSSQKDSEIVCFAEDDYFYLPNQFAALVSFLQSAPDVDFVTPYDHPDYYSGELHQDRAEIRLHGTRHFRTAASTCLTFLTRRETLRETARVFHGYGQGNPDAGLWLCLTRHSVFRPLRTLRWALTHWDEFTFVGRAWIHGWRQILFGKRRKLWVPIPSAGTHLESTGLAPGFDWKSQFGAFGGGIGGG